MASLRTLLFLSLVVGFASSFSVIPHAYSRNNLVSTCLKSSPNDDENNDEQQQEPLQKKQERLLEELSSEGADKIAKLDIQERTKRAMLAEQVEDRIFELSDQLEEMFDENYLLPESNREQAVELAQQTKSLQLQYQELVSGKPSTILEALD
jgi:flagellar basal body-associated protein FliL